MSSPPPAVEGSILFQNDVTAVALTDPRRPRTAEIALCEAMLTQAIADTQLHPGSMIAAAARRWFLSDSDTHWGDYIVICDRLNLDYTAVRPRVLTGPALHIPVHQRGGPKRPAQQRA